MRQEMREVAVRLGRWEFSGVGGRLEGVQSQRRGHIKKRARQGAELG